MMRVYVESILPCPPHAAWDEVQKSALLVEVARPLVVIKPLRGETLPQRWLEGATVRSKAYLFGIVPFGTRTLRFERVDQHAREIQTRERDALIKKWDHLIRIAEAHDGQTHYSDEIEIDAGLLTPLVWLFASWFYRHRQRKWQKVACRLAQEDSWRP